MSNTSRLRGLFSGAWPAGDIMAAAVVALFGGLVALTVIANLAHWSAGSVDWLWLIAGGASGDTTQQSMARAAWVGIVVGLVTIALLAFTLAYTNIATRISLLSVEQAQTIGQAQVRAYIGAHDVTFRFPGGRNFHVPPEISVKISNTGQTPAKQVRMKMGWQNWPPDELVRVDPAAPFSAQEIGAGQTIEENIPCWDFIGDALMVHLVGDGSSTVQGVIEYSDVFGIDRQTWFRVTVTGDYTGAVPKLFSAWAQTGNIST